MLTPTYTTCDFEYIPRRNIFIEPPTEPREETPETECADCEDGIYKGSSFIDVDGKNVCFSCIEESYHKDRTDSFLDFIGHKSSLKDLLELLGIEVYTAG